MGTIVDILLLDPANIDLLKEQYPGCVLTNLSKTTHRLQEYKLIVPDLDQYEDSYYFFLYDKSCTPGKAGGLIGEPLKAVV